MQVQDPDQRNALWLALIQREVDATEGNEADISNRMKAIDRCVGERLLRGTLAVEDALGCLPEQETLFYYKKVLLKHMEASSHKVCIRVAQVEVPVCCLLLLICGKQF